MKGFLLLGVLLVLVITSAFASADQQIAEIYPQPDSPLQLSNPVSRWRISKKTDGEELEMLTVYYVAHNVSPKIIRALTIRHFEGDFKTSVGGTSSMFTLKENGIFQPDQLRTESIGEFGSLPKPKSLKLAVDFIEFTDGTTWGEDLSESGKRMQGVKEGVKKALEYLRRIFKQNGIEATVKALDELKDLVPAEEQNYKWKDGFKTGINHLGSILKRLYDEEGVKAFEAELQKQFFSSS